MLKASAIAMTSANKHRAPRHYFTQQRTADSPNSLRNFGFKQDLPKAKSDEREAQNQEDVEDLKNVTPLPPLSSSPFFRSGRTKTTRSRTSRDTPSTSRPSHGFAARSRILRRATSSNWTSSKTFPARKNRGWISLMTRTSFNSWIHELSSFPSTAATTKD